MTKFVTHFTFWKSWVAEAAWFLRKHEWQWSQSWRWSKKLVHILILFQSNCSSQRSHWATRAGKRHGWDWEEKKTHVEVKEMVSRDHGKRKMLHSRYTLHKKYKPMWLLLTPNVNYKEGSLARPCALHSPHSPRETLPVLFETCLTAISSFLISLLSHQTKSCLLSLHQAVPLGTRIIGNYLLPSHQKHVWCTKQSLKIVCNVHE